MASKITDTVKNLLDGMHAISQTETIVGEPTQVGDATVIPVHRLRVGFVAGAVAAGGHGAETEGKTGSRAVGGTAQLDPVAVIAIGPDGKPRLLAVDGDPTATWQRLLQEAPELVSRLLRKVTDRVELFGAAKKPAEAAAPLGTPQTEPARLPDKK